MLGDNIKLLRESMGLSQQELAARLHVVRQTVSKWERNMSVPDAQLLMKLAEILGVSTERLLCASEETNNTKGDSDNTAAMLAAINDQLARRNKYLGVIYRLLLIPVIVVVCVWLTMLITSVSACTVYGSVGTEAEVYEIVENATEP